jgi:hypothetical protein
MTEPQTETQLPVIHIEMNLSELAETLVASAEGRIQLTEEQQETARSLLLRKVDKCNLFHFEVEDEIARYERIASEFSAHANALRKKLQSFDAYVANVLQWNQLEKVTGEQFQITLRKSTYCEMPARAPTEQDFEVMGPEFVRRTEVVERSWDKVKITAALKNGSFPFENIGQLKERVKPVYDIKRGKL